MNRAELEAYIEEVYGADTDHPWAKYPRYQVFRQHNNQKWFALLMEVPKEKLGLHGKEPLDVVNVKCDPTLIGSLLHEKGCFPAYHMSKANWITIALDGTASDEMIQMLLDMSYNATAAKPKKRKSE